MRDSADPPLPDERRTALLQAAVAVFARYGYRKASMDEVARAAGLSRQGLYLYFSSKEILFREGLAFLLASSLRAGLAALSDPGRSAEDILVTAFDAMHGQYVDSLGTTPHLAELMETSTRLVGPLIQEQERTFLTAVTEALERTGIARAWKPAGLSARELAEMLEAVAYGLKHRVTARADYLLHIRRAARVVCYPAATPTSRTRSRKGS